MTQSAKRVTWQTSSEYRRLLVPGGRTLRLVRAENSNSGNIWVPPPLYMLLLSEGQMVKPGKLQSNAVSESDAAESTAPMCFVDLKTGTETSHHSQLILKHQDVTITNTNRNTQFNCDHPVIFIQVCAVAK